ncbi:MAG: lipoate--protein ligase family protein [Armatimonadota bacterium]
MVSGRWRLVLDPPKPGAWNMAVDEALFRRADQRGGVPVLRMYQWAPPCVSLGRFQRADTSLKLDACRRLGVDVVRRPTGGRAILHEHEVTYSVTAPLGGTGVIESYRELSAGLVRALELLGIRAEYGSQPAPGPGSRASCFAHAARCDIVAGGKKIIGSAQVRGTHWVLQQGSIPLWVDWNHNAAVFGWTDGTEAGAAGSLPDAAGKIVTAEEVQAAVVRGFEEALGIQFEPGRLTSDEQELAAVLVQTKYGTERWTFEGEAQAVETAVPSPRTS